MNVATPHIPKIPQRVKSLLTKKRLIVAGSVIAAILVVTPILTYAAYARDITDPDRLMNRNSSGIILKDRTGKTFYEYGVVSDGDTLSLNKVSDTVEEALLASEDRSFYDHKGYSIRGILGATRDNIMDADATSRGGSTITQQLVKNKLLTNDKNFFRKYQELSMAIAIERRYTKTEILEMYLNSVYFGEGAFGIQEAAKRYYNTNPSELSVAQSAMLIGVLPAPSLYSPVSGDKEASKQQQERVLNAMVDAGYISDSELQAAKNETLTYAPSREANFATAQHFTMMVLEKLQKEYGEERVIRSGFIVTTTLDYKQQKDSERAVKEQVATFSAAGGRNASLVSMDPKNGEIRSLVGSVNWDDEVFGKVNMATSPRQPGSSFKPVYYAEALEKKLITAATVMKDERKTYGGTYTPENYDFKFRGDISIRNALAQSLNIPAVDVMQKLGPDDASNAARRMGVSTVTEPEKYGLSLALGTAEVKLNEMVHAYTAFANKGEQFEPTLVTQIENKYGKEVFKKREQEPKKVISAEAAYLISSIISDERARAPTFGSSLNIPGHTAAVKTGTTNDNKDAWTVGYTPNIVTGVWVGNNENEAMNGLAGGSSAGRIWHRTMSAYLENKENEQFEKPSGITEKQVCAAGSSAYREYFIKGTEPSEGCKKQPVEKENKREKREEKEDDDDDDDEENQEEKPNNNRPEGGRGAGEEPDEDDDEADAEQSPETAPQSNTRPPSENGSNQGNERNIQRQNQNNTNADDTEDDD
jgi:1A family penicillin-binding protein